MELRFMSQRIGYIVGIKSESCYTLILIRIFHGVCVSLDIAINDIVYEGNML